MAKTKMMECRHCRIDTKHRVRKVCYKPHSSGSKSGGMKYLMEHCTACNRRFYNGKAHREVKASIAKHVSASGR